MPLRFAFHFSDRERNCESSHRPPNYPAKTLSLSALQLERVNNPFPLGLFLRHFELELRTHRGRGHDQTDALNMRLSSGGRADVRRTAALYELRLGRFGRCDRSSMVDMQCALRSVERLSNRNTLAKSAPGAVNHSRRDGNMGKALRVQR